MVTNTPIFVRSSQPSNGRLAGSIVLNNIKLNNVPTAVGVAGGAVVLSGGTTTINSWGQGNVYSGSNGSPSFTKGNIAAPSKPSSLLDGSGRIFGRTRPQYESYAVGSDTTLACTHVLFIHPARFHNSLALKTTVPREMGERTTQLLYKPSSTRSVGCSGPPHLSLMTFLVLWMQNHLLRRRNLHRHLDSHHTCGYSNGWRGLVDHFREGFRFPRHK